LKHAKLCLLLTEIFFLLLEVSFEVFFVILLLHLAFKAADFTLTFAKRLLKRALLLLAAVNLNRLSFLLELEEVLVDNGLLPRFLGFKFLRFLPDLELLCTDLHDETVELALLVRVVVGRKRDLGAKRLDWVSKHAYIDLSDVDHVV
jgi:hypothetical protein